MTLANDNPIALLLQEPEGKRLEFKRDARSPRPWLKSIVAFANSAGGRLVFGVTDDRQVVGIENPLDEEERLANLIADSIAPRLVPNIEMTTVDAKTLLMIEVFLSGARPHFIKAEGMEGGTYVRLGSTNRQADAALIGELKRSVNGGSFDELPMPSLTLEDLDRAAIIQAFGTQRILDDQALLSLKLISHDQGRMVPTRGGILLFGKDRTQHFSDAWVQCGRFYGREKLDILDHAEIIAPLPQTVDQVILFLQKHAYRGADLSAIRRKDRWSIPLSILREAIINALVHGDYAQRGAPIRVVFLDNRIEIESPGILLPGLTIDEIKQGTSRIRNHVIARVFRELHLIEQWGTGVRRIFAEAKAEGLPEPIIEEIGMRLRLTIYLAVEHRSTRSGEHTAAQQEPGDQSRDQSRDQSVRVLQSLSDSELSASEIARSLDMPKKSGALKRAIKALLEEGMVEYTLPDKPNSRLQTYRLTEKGFKAITEKSAKKEQT
ncbi:helix-turn-helix domain-containing protein [Halochromatium roseum]|uniref:AlbA family DNA-binding domain-containing protein n=1 Tax=Halochromatium roseum TaxID=391920 RepID=UPI001912F70D|nr:helix-turn-helix domain-containing protein [Halochromatium roseum]MBK5941354.1 AAA family ATPase [Halochromatium roseum]